LVEQAKADAQKEADRILTQAQAALETEKAAAIEDLKRQVAGFSLEIAEKVLQSELEDHKKQTALVEKLLKDVNIK